MGYKLQTPREENPGPIIWYKWILNRLFGFNYFIHTDRRGWIHCDRITKQDINEANGYMLTPFPLK